MTPSVGQLLLGDLRWCVEQGDALDVLRTIPDHSLDAVVCDPPAGIAFMGAAWDRDKGGRRQWIDWLASIMREALRVVKPGAHALVWALPRTSHWTATALEDAGWEIRDCIVHMQGQGFPKHEDALKPAQEHWWLARAPLSESSVKANVARWGTGGLDVDGCRIAGPKPATVRGAGGQNGRYAPIAAQGRIEDDGRGRWPPNAVFSHADGCERVGERRVRGFKTPVGHATPITISTYGDFAKHSTIDHTDPDGTETADDWRCTEGCPVAELAAQSGERKAGWFSGKSKRGMGYHGSDQTDDVAPSAGIHDQGTAARFFPQFTPDAPEPLSDLLVHPFIYAPKTRRTERNAGCDTLTEKPSDPYAGHRHRRMEGEPVRMDGAPSARSANHHPTVKPLALMRWLVRLVTPAGGVVLDMFGGSGSTGCAAVLEGRRALLIEREEDFAAIACARVAHWSGTVVDATEGAAPTMVPAAATHPAPSAATSAPAPSPPPPPHRRPPTGQLVFFG